MFGFHVFLPMITPFGDLLRSQAAESYSNRFGSVNLFDFDE
jgi:hypothetical protein